MGIDHLDLCFRIERVFKIKFVPVQSYFGRAFSFSLKYQRVDLQVCDLVIAVETALKDQSVACERDVFELLRTEIARCLVVDESEVTLQTWMRQDLGME